MAFVVVDCEVGQGILLETKMVKQLYSLLLGIVFAVCVAHAEDSYLWWMFDAGTQIQEVNGTGFVTIDQLTGRGDAAGKTVNAIRIAAYKGGSLEGHLNMAEVDADVDIPSIYNMPTLTGSSEPYTETWNAGPSYVDLGAYATDPTASFVIELGFWDWGAGTDSELNWTVLAYSDPGTVNSLEAFIHDSNYDMQSKLEWTGGHYVVPEPTSGILLLIGGALLSLRRRRRRVDGSEDRVRDESVIRRGGGGDGKKQRWGIRLVCLPRAVAICEGRLFLLRV